MFDPPFNKEHSIFTFPVDGISNNVLSPPPESLTPSSTLSLNSHGIALGLPAFFYGGNSLQKLHSADPTILKSYFRAELDVCRLNRIHKHLWIAGQERPARALHHQTLIGRRVIVTEDPSLHLLWIDASLFVKPLPDFILCHDAWESIRVEQNLFEGAVGMLLSYIWLVRTKSDLRIAHSEGLLPCHLNWEQWTSLTATALTRIDHLSFQGINPRYRYGELRLRRINWIWAFCSHTISISSMLRGYFYAYYDYQTWFQRHTAWVTATTIYVALVLTAMQVGLETDRLQKSQAFQNASYVFTVFAILAPLGILSLILVALGVLVMWNLCYTLTLMQRKSHEQQRVWENDVLKRWAH